MTSILTNTAAMSSLQVLSVTQRQLSKTQDQVFSGLAISQAADGAAYWSIGKRLTTQVATLSSITDGLALAATMTSVTSTAVDQIITVVQGMKADLVTASQAGANLSAIQADLSARQKEIVTIAQSASFNGTNWLVPSKTANVTITETHQFGGNNTFGYIDAQSQKYTSYRDENDPPYLDPTKPPPSGYAFRDSVTYTSSAIETDQDGTSKSENISYSGTDSDQAYTQQYWYQDQNGHYEPGQYEAIVRNAYTSASPSNFSDAGSVDFSGFEDSDIPMGLAQTGSVSMAVVDTTQFNLFTAYTGTTTVTETTTDAGGAKRAGSIVFGDRSHMSMSPYASYDVDNGFEENSGALDGDLRGQNPSDLRSTDPEDDLGLGTKVTLLNFCIDGSDPTHAFDDIPSTMDAIETALTSLQTISTSLGGLANRISSQRAFDGALSDALTSGLGSLVDADMNVASTRLQALQTQQQLGIQALSIANQNSQLILKLFGQG